MQDTILKKLIGLSLLNPEPVQRASRFALHKIQVWNPDISWQE